MLKSYLCVFTYAPVAAFRNVAMALILSTLSAYAAPVTVLALGDSLTEGYGLPPEQGFVPQMQAWLAANGQAVALINAGVSGDTTAGGLSRTDWSLTPEVQAVILNLGGNDLLRGLDPALSRANLDAILRKTSARHLPVLMVALQAPGNYGAEYKAAFDAMYPELAQRYGALLSAPYFAPLIDPASGSPDASLMQADGLHPNAQGVKKAVAALGPDVLALLAKLDK